MSQKEKSKELTQLEPPETLRLLIEIEPTTCETQIKQAIEAVLRQLFNFKAMSYYYFGKITCVGLDCDKITERKTVN